MTKLDVAAALFTCTVFGWHIEPWLDSQSAALVQFSGILPWIFIHHATHLQHEHDYTTMRPAPSGLLPGPSSHPGSHPVERHCFAPHQHPIATAIALP